MAAADRDRAPYEDVGRAMRSTIKAANAAGLTALQLRTLAAVLAMTASYSRLRDRVWLDQVAAVAYGVDEAKPWMREKARKALVALDGLGLIERVAPKGRPPAGSHGPAYLIGLHPAPEMQPSLGLRWDRERQPDPVEKAARSRREKQPAPGGPTEEVSEEYPEEGGHPTRARLGRFAAMVTTPAGRLDPDELEHRLGELEREFDDELLDAVLDRIAAERFRFPRQAVERVRSLAPTVAKDLGRHRPDCTCYSCHQGRGAA